MIPDLTTLAPSTALKPDGEIVKQDHHGGEIREAEPQCFCGDASLLVEEVLCLLFTSLNNGSDATKDQEEDDAEVLSVVLGSTPL